MIVFLWWTRADTQLWRSKFDPFIRSAQKRYCSKLIAVPLPVFHQMAESIGDPKGGLIFVINTGRCGSTLLMKVISQYYRPMYEFICYSSVILTLVNWIEMDKRIIRLSDHPVAPSSVFTDTVTLYLSNIPTRSLSSLNWDTKYTGGVWKFLHCLTV